MLDFLLEYSEVAKSLEPPVTLNELLRCYCKTPERLTYVVDLLKRLPEFANEKLKLSNCLIRGQLPYDSLIGLTEKDLHELCKVMDYLDFPESLMEKLEPVLENMTLHEKYDIGGFSFNYKNTVHWCSVGDIDGLIYAHTHGFPLTERACEEAAISGELECLKYAHTHIQISDKKTYLNGITSQFVAQNGHLNCLKYLHEQNCPWDKWTCAYAALGGHLECLKYSHTHGCHWDEITCKYAASGGHFECLKYAHSEGCPWNKSTCEHAARNGHLECLKYAHTQGCPWDETTCEYAALNGHLECLKYAYTHGCPWNKNTRTYPAPNCLDYLREHGYFK